MLWKRHFEQWPLVGGTLSPGVLVSTWPLGAKAGDALSKGDPDVKKARGKGCQYKRRPAGDYLLAASADNRLVIERWSEGAPVAHTFGRGIVFYLIHGRLAVRNLDSELMVLDEATGSKLRRLQLPDRIVPAGFRAAGNWESSRRTNACTPSRCHEASPTAHSHPSILECATRRGRQLAAAASFQTAIAFAATREIYMSAIATTSQLTRSIGFYQATIGKKVVMAVTGVILFGYVLGHLIGNLQIYSPDTQQINNYARFLHSHVLLLWAVRALLLASVVLHITASVQLWLLKQKARPEAYVKKDDVPASYAARTMIWSGPIIAAFVVFHVLHLTVGSVLPLHTLPDGDMDVRANVITGFRNPAVAIFYIVAMALLCMHLYHGLWSMFQSLGVNHPRYTPIIKKFAAAFAWFVAIGNISIPVAVLAGVLTLQ